MDEDRIKRLFDDYNPQLGPDSRFVAELEWKLNAVENIRAQMELRGNARRLGMAMAAITGFILGVISTLCYPVLSGLIAEAAAFSETLTMIVEEYGTTLLWSSLCLLTATSAYAVYDMAVFATCSGRIAVAPYLFKDRGR